MSVLRRAIQSYRFWTAVVGIAVTIGIYLGLPEDVAQAVSNKVLLIVGILIGSDTIRRTEER